MLSVSHLSKKMCRDLRRSQWYGVLDVAGEFTGPSRVGATAALRPHEFWAIHDVSFEMRRGESLAVMGANGAGKTTLLKLLYGLVKPDAGEARIRGRVGALIELGTGFDPVLSGRENVHVNAALHGFTARETAQLMDEVADFAELEDVMDTPLQFYSSGMQARLSYAVAARMRPDLLLVDEVLAVGDLGFQRKCVNHMRQYLDNGGALVFVSHNSLQIQAVCQRAILLEEGRLTCAGSAVETTAVYLKTQRPRASAGELAPALPILDDASPALIEAVTAEALDCGTVRTGDALRVTVQYRALAGVHAICAVSIWTGDLWVCITSTFSSPRQLDVGMGELRCVIPRLPLVAGTYYVRAILVDPVTEYPLAAFGWSNSPFCLDVHADSTRQLNASVAAQQLVIVDADWE